MPRETTPSPPPEVTALPDRRDDAAVPQLGVGVVGTTISSVPGPISDPPLVSDAVREAGDQGVLCSSANTARDPKRDAKMTSSWGPTRDVPGPAPPSRSLPFDPAHWDLQPTESDDAQGGTIPPGPFFHQPVHLCRSIPHPARPAPLLVHAPGSARRGVVVPSRHAVPVQPVGGAPNPVRHARSVVPRPTRPTGDAPGPAGCVSNPLPGVCDTCSLRFVCRNPKRETAVRRALERRHTRCLQYALRGGNIKVNFVFRSVPHVQVSAT